MPADFDRCRAEGGKIRTQDLGHGEYRHICIDAKGKTHAGEVKKRIIVKMKPKGK